MLLLLLLHEPNPFCVGAKQGALSLAGSRMVGAVSCCCIESCTLFAVHCLLLVAVVAAAIATALPAAVSILFVCHSLLLANNSNINNNNNSNSTNVVTCFAVYCSLLTLSLC